MDPLAPTAIAITLAGVVATLAGLLFKMLTDRIKQLEQNEAKLIAKNDEMQKIVLSAQTVSSQGLELLRDLRDELLFGQQGEPARAPWTAHRRAARSRRAGSSGSSDQ